MSFDLAVWPEPAVVTAEAAERTYESLCEREPGAVPADARVVAFHRELTARYPSLSSLPWTSSRAARGPVTRPSSATPCC
jgi:hypothetical protein